MGDIYTERGITETPTVNIGEMSTASDVRRTGKIFDDIKEQAQEKAEKHQRLAKELYKNGSSLAIHNGLEELLRNPDLASNPEAYSREADKVASKVYGDIQDQEVKAEVILDYELRKGAFVNKTYSNYYKKQDDEKEYQTLVSIDNAMKNTGISLQNIMNGDFSVDDAMNIKASRENIEKHINEKDSLGFDLFTPQQKMQIRQKYDENILSFFKEAYDKMKIPQRERIAKMVSDGSDVKVVTDKSGQQHSLGMFDSLPENLSKDMKKYVKDSSIKDMETKAKQFKLMQEQSEIDFINNPSQTTFDNFLRLNPSISDKKKADYEELLKQQPNYKAETTYDSVDEAREAIVEIGNMPKDTTVQRADALDQYAQVILNMKSSNQKGTMTTDDVDELSQLAYKTFNDQVFQEQVHKVFGKPGIFRRTVHSILIPPWETSTFKKIDQIGLNTTRDAIHLLLSGDPEGAEKVYREGQKRAIRLQYNWLPLDSMKEGDMFEEDGKTYKFMGYSLDDVFVEVVK